MTAPDPTTRAEDGAGRDYVLIKRGLYWRPGAQGYTGLLSEAGRYSAADAAAYAAHDNDSTRAWPADEAREFAPACWQETMLAFRTKERDEAESRAATAEAEVARLREALAEAEREHTDMMWQLRRAEERSEDAEASASALRERVAVLEAILKPFSEAAENLDDDEHGHLWESPAAMALDAEHLRAARTALEAHYADD
ncbi:hypothetical protein [Methylobacterium persicinum]|uniref:Uncharacterized protein n=1 Tax=Methylobacterium persicinum TaxID=374426 RepID=A0ABU0HJW8_9HYPH|nr:hypothetical protein [Methylobacterium persicinum]MDQ0442606.1 hypothetical protein [Methylobacterium persicinum]GJE37812.1 Chromosome partition protein Smc [Methylobacterium persicinum]